VGGGVGWLVMMKRKEGTKAPLFFIADNLSGNFIISVSIATVGLLFFTSSV
jgi:hypothetical protein